MKVLCHGNSIKFICKDCGCVFSELPKKCYSSTGSDGAHYCMVCPECNCTCWTNDDEQKEVAYNTDRITQDERENIVSWLGKFCSHIDNRDKWLTDEENLAFFKEKMKQQFGWDTD